MRQSTSAAIPAHSAPGGRIGRIATVVAVAACTVTSVGLATSQVSAANHKPTISVRTKTPTALPQRRWAVNAFAAGARAMDRADRRVFAIRAAERWAGAVAANRARATVTASPRRYSGPRYSNSNPGTFLSCVRGRESGGNYGASNGQGYWGAYQFSQSTWNATARHAGRPDLVGQNPASADPATQDTMAQALYGWQGSSPWSHGRYKC